MKLLLLFTSILCSAAIVDGIVATVGRTIITDSMVRRSLRTSAFSEGAAGRNSAVWKRIATA
jgi:hypothetical protein